LGKAVVVALVALENMVGQRLIMEHPEEEDRITLAIFRLMVPEELSHKIRKPARLMLFPEELVELKHRP
jgi:hypothetical protein